MSVGSVEALLTYGSDFSVGSDGDLVVIQDTAIIAPASEQRLLFLVLTVPAFYDQFGNPTTIPDDIIHPTYGAGLPAQVDEQITADMLSTVERQILAAVSTDASFVQNPPPSVTFTTYNSNTVNVTVTAQTVTGVVITTPALPLVSQGSPVSIQGS